MKPGPIDEYAAFCRAARRLTGVDVEQYRREQTERRIRALAHRRGATGLLDYLLLLRRDEAERDLFRDRITINVSQLWRNPEHWQLLSERVLPDLTRRPGTVRAWSAGCSHGAEPVTLAMAWRDVAGDRPIEIRATDIDEASIDRARSGRFSADDVRDVPREIRTRWMERDDEGWVVRPELRRLIRFAVEDIFTPTTPERYDLVLCRNVVIYLTPERRDQVHRLLAYALRPGGWLMVGATERISNVAELELEPVHPFVYRKRDLGKDPFR